MRVTLGMLNSSVRTNLMSSTNRLLDAQEKASSGKRINQPSDDVPGIGRSLSLRSALSSIEQFTRNSSLASAQMGVASTTLDSVVNALQSARTLAVRAASDSLNSEALTGISSQLQSISNQLVGLANTQHLGKYIFSGTMNTTTPIVANTGGPTPPFLYQGNNTKVQMEVAPDTYSPVTVTGDEVFNMGSTAVPGVPDVFATIQSLKDAVSAGDISTISSLISDIDANLQNATGVRSELGAWMNRLDATANSLADSKVRMQTMLSDVEDVDTAEAILDLRTQEYVYQAAVSVAGRVLQTTLADYLS
jgi:flagellar hook-associated protein 3 FlgL